MIKISVKEDKPALTTDLAMIFRSLFKKELHLNENFQFFPSHFH